MNLNKNLGRIVFDPTIKIIDEKLFDVVSTKKEEWDEFYPDTKEIFSYKVIVLLRNRVRIRVYINVNYRCNMMNWRSYSGIIIHVNNTSIVWYSKR